MGVVIAANTIVIRSELGHSPSVICPSPNYSITGSKALDIHGKEQSAFQLNYMPIQKNSSGDIAFEIGSQEKPIFPEMVVSLLLCDNWSCTSSQVSLCTSAARKLKTKLETELTVCIYG